MKCPKGTFKGCIRDVGNTTVNILLSFLAIQALPHIAKEKGIDIAYMPSLPLDCASDSHLRLQNEENMPISASALGCINTKLPLGLSLLV